MSIRNQLHREENQIGTKEGNEIPLKSREFSIEVSTVGMRKNLIKPVMDREVERKYLELNEPQFET